MKIQDTKTRSLGRREFNTLCAALGLSLSAGCTMLAALSHEAALAAAGGSQSDPRSVKFHDVIWHRGGVETKAGARCRTDLVGWQCAGRQAIAVDNHALA